MGVYDVVYVAFVVCFGFGCVIVFPISVCDELGMGVSGECLRVAKHRQMRSIVTID